MYFNVIHENKILAKTFRIYITKISSADPKLFYLYVLCVTGSTPYAVKTTAGPCYDRISSCDAYSQSACVEPYLYWAQQNCERTCNLCSKKIFYIQICGSLKFITLVTDKGSDKSVQNIIISHSIRGSRKFCQWRSNSDVFFLFLH